MPSLDYPRSILQCLETLRRAKLVAEQVDPSELVLTPPTLSALNGLYQRFEDEVREKDVVAGQLSKTAQGVLEAANALRTYLSHYLQTLNMAIARGELDAAERSMLQLSSSQDTLPTLSSEADLMTWGGRIIQGETERQAAGLIPITLPALENIQKKYEDFKAARVNRDHAESATSKEAEDVKAMRDEVDDFIREDLWYEIIGAFRKEDAGAQRRKARKWGVRYRYSKGETPLEGEEVDSEGKDIVNE